MMGTFLIFLLCLIGTRGESCTQNSNCTETQICIQGTCQCDILSYARDDKCLKYATEYNEYCEEAEQCKKWLGSNSNCINSVCTCNSGSRWYQGECKPYSGKGEACSNSIDCFDEMDPLALTCNKGKCVCNTGYYDRGNDCRIESKEGGGCAINKDCNPSKDLGLVCHLGTCQRKTMSSDDLKLLEDQKESYTDVKTIQHLILFQSGDGSDNCERDLDCINMANSICNVTTKQCICKNDNYFLTTEGNCLAGLTICDPKHDRCSLTITNSYCFTSDDSVASGVCVCRQGYFLFQKQCIPELGQKDETLKTDTDCKIRPGKVVDNTCYCKDYWFGDKSNRKCIKTTLQQTYSCLTSDWCNAMGPYSFCNSSSLCQCVDINGFNEENFYCNTSSDVQCLRDYECDINQRCVNNTCTCINHFMDKDGKCLPALEGSCDLVNKCSAEDSDCIGGVCNCQSDFIGYNNTCLKMVDNWDDDCQITDQCTKLKFSECSSESQKCTCIKNFLRQPDGKCWEEKNYGDPCMTSDQCTVVLDDSFQCRNNKCVYPIGQDLNGSSSTATCNTILSFSSMLLILCLTRVLV